MKFRPWCKFFSHRSASLAETKRARFSNGQTRGDRAPLALTVFVVLQIQLRREASGLWRAADSTRYQSRARTRRTHSRLVGGRRRDREVERARVRSAESRTTVPRPGRPKTSPNTPPVSQSVAEKSAHRHRVCCGNFVLSDTEKKTFTFFFRMILASSIHHVHKITTCTLTEVVEIFFCLLYYCNFGYVYDCISLEFRQKTFRIQFRKSPRIHSIKIHKFKFNSISPAFDGFLMFRLFASFAFFVAAESSYELFHNNARAACNGGGQPE